MKPGVVNGRTRFITAVVGFVVAGALASCTRDPTRDSAQDPAWIESAEAVAEYFDEAGRLDLAPGWKWPTDPGYVNVAPDGKKVFYGVNAGRVDAAWYWHCSWARTYFSATNDQDREAALAQVLRLRESAFFTFGLLERDRRTRAKVLQSAADGDSSMLRRIIEINCPQSST